MILMIVHVIEKTSTEEPPHSALSPANPCMGRCFVVICKFGESFHCYLHHTVQMLSKNLVTEPTVSETASKCSFP